MRMWRGTRIRRRMRRGRGRVRRMRRGRGRGRISKARQLAMMMTKCRGAGSR